MENEQKTPRKIRLDDVHWNIIEGLTPFYGSTPAEVVRTIVIMWLHNDLGSNTMDRLIENDAIKLGKRK